MLILVPKPYKHLAHLWRPNLGLLVSPRRGWDYDDLDISARAGIPWACDNDAYSGFDEGAYLDMLEKVCHIPRCGWVTCPDVVGNATETLLLFYEWHSVVRATGLPVALVAQDGMVADDVPWHLIDALFIGGTNDGEAGKRSDAMIVLITEAKKRGKWVHVGRIGGGRLGIRWAKSHGADSIDSSRFARWSDLELPWALEFAAADSQMRLVGEVE